MSQLYLVSSDQLKGFAGLETPRKTVRLGSHYYDAAASPRDVAWPAVTVGTDEQLFNVYTRAIVLGRFRQEVRNNPYLAGLVKKYPEAIGNTSLRSRSSAKEYNDAKNLFWFRYSKRVTISGDSLRTVESILLQELPVAGELFIVFLVNGRVQLVASEMCGGSPIGAPRGRRETNGIVYDASNRPLAYRFGKMGISGAVEYTGTDSDLVDARYVIHVFDKDRVLQGRGLPWLLPSLKFARDLYEITRSKTKQIKDANSISGFIEKQGAAAYFDSLNQSPPPLGDVDPATGIELPNAPADPKGAQPITIELASGTFIALEPGEKVNTLMSEYHAADYKELIMLMLHAISSPLGLPVELWFSGLGDVNYSGFKGLGTQWNGRRRHVIAFLEDQLYYRWQFWRCAKAQNEGDLPRNPDADEDLVDFGWRATSVLDDEKAAKANEVRLRTGERSLADVWEENGDFPEEVLAHRRELWIKLQIAAGKLKEGADTAAVQVPLTFLLYGQISAPVSPFAPSVAAPPAPPTDSPQADPEADPAQAPASNDNSQA